MRTLILAFAMTGCTFHGGGEIDVDVECTSTCDEDQQDCYLDCETECADATDDGDSACDTDCKRVCDDEYDSCTVSCES
jgi:hypothetical protein